MGTMSEMHFLERILNQLTELYVQILSNQNKNLSVTPAMKDRIERLSKEIDEISHFTDMQADLMGIRPETIKRTILDPNSHLPVEIQQLLKKSSHLKGQVEGCRNILKEIIKKQKEENKNDSKKRRGKFKNVGGKDGWIPM